MRDGGGEDEPTRLSSARRSRYALGYDESLFADVVCGGPLRVLRGSEIFLAFATMAHGEAP